MSGWEAVANEITQRMAELDMSQKELSHRSKVSVATLRELTNGPFRRRSDTTLAAISRALRWPDNHLSRVSNGFEVPQAITKMPSDELTERLERIALALEELSERVTSVESRLDAADAPLPPNETEAS